MGDPISLASGIAGLITLGLGVSSGLVQYYESYKDSQSDIAALYNSADALSQTFNLLNKRINATYENPKPLFSREVVDQVTSSIVACAGGINKLCEKLEKAKGTKPGFTARIRKAQYPFKQKTLEKLQGTIADLRGNLSLALDALHIEIANSIQEELHLICGNISSIGESSLRAEELDILKWLSPLEPHAKQLDIVSRRQQSTGTWLLQSTEFSSWLDSDDKVLWCWGMPGAGKTYMTSIIIDHLEQHYRPPGTAIAYAYCDYTDGYQTARNLLGSLLQQIAQQSRNIADIKACHAEHTRTSTRPTRPTLGELSRMLQVQTNGLEKAFLVIDALDEFPETNNARQQLLAELRKVIPSSRLLVTSRQIPSIEKEFKQHRKLEIRANDDDVRSFVQSRFEQQQELMDLLDGRDELRGFITDSIVEKTKGMFLRAALHMDSLAQQDNISDLRYSLRHLPEDLDKIYDKAMDRIASQDKRKSARAEQILILLNCAMRPLRVTEMLCALAVRPGDQDLDEDAIPKADAVLSACCGLVVLDRESQIVKLVHYTTEEYFERKGDFHSPNAHRKFAGILLTYLNFPRMPRVATDETYVLRALEFFSDEYEQMHEELRRENVLLEYAIQHWGDHVRQALLPADEVNLVSGLGAQEVRALEHGKPDHSSHTWNIEGLVNSLLAAKLHLSLYSLFLDENSRVDADFESLRHVPDLWILASFGISTLVTMCIERGDDVDERCFEYTAVELAARGGHLEVVRRLVAAGACLYAEDSKHDPLEQAICGGHLDVFRFLLIQTQPPLKWKHIQYAVCLGQLEMLESLMLNMSNSSTVDKLAGSALRSLFRPFGAVPHGFQYHDNIFRFLMSEDKGWKISKTTREVVLCYAAGCARLDCVKSLLRTDVDIKAARCTSILLDAVRDDSQPRLEVIRHLLELGAPPNVSRPDDGYVLHDITPLAKAVMSESTNTVKLLVEYGADLEQPGGRWRGEMSVLECAVSFRKREGVQLLLELGADPRSCPPHYYETDQQELYDLVLAAQSKFGGSVLEYAVGWGRPINVRRILGHGVAPESCSSSMKRCSEKVKESDFRECVRMVTRAKQLYHDEVLYKQYMEELGRRWVVHDSDYTDRYLKKATCPRRE